MSLFVWILLFCLLGGVLSVIAASLFLVLPESLRSRLIPHAVSFSIGALLGAALLGLLPHALAANGVEDFHHITGTVLLGIFVFFLLEKLVLWRHCHSDHCEVHGQDEPGHTAAGTLILIGDGLHNFIDGILIGAAFLTDIHLGIVTSVAVAAHEIPQEVGDFAVLLHSGYTRKKAFLFNILSSLATVLGGMLAWFSLQNLESSDPVCAGHRRFQFYLYCCSGLNPWAA